MLALDKGPGIKNISESLRDGYSTAGSAGTGMGAISRLADRFDVYSQVGKGTAIFAQFWPKKRAPEPAFEIGGVSVAVEGEQLCGMPGVLVALPAALQYLWPTVWVMDI